MLLVMSGTADGRKLVEELNRRGVGLLTTVATTYGEATYRQIGLRHLCVRARLDGQALTRFIEEHGITTIVDATHPYATQASLNAMRASKGKGIKYLRLERERTVFPESPLIHKAGSVEEAVELSGRLGTRILLTTGYNSIARFIKLRNGKELIVRILPVPEHVQGCIKMGIPPRNILALQGPFSKGFNKATIKEFNIDVVVTKDGGKEARTLEKVEACLEETVPIVIIERPRLNYPIVYSSIQDILSVLGIGVKATP